MVLASLIAAAHRMHPLKGPVLVVAASVLVALFFTLATRPEQEPPRIAGEANVSLIQDEHALVAGYVRADLAARQAAAERDRAEMRAEIRSSAAAVSAQAVAHIAEQPASQRGRTTAPRTPNAVPVAGPPLQLQAVAPTPQEMPAHPIRRHARAALAAVERIPEWVRDGVESAADWAIVGPVKTIARWPERRFL